MPKEVLHKGALYLLKSHPKTETVGAWTEELEYDPPRYAYPGAEKAENRPLPDDVVVTSYPSVEIFWSKPEDRAPVAAFEDEEGFVQFGMDVSREEILRVAEELKKNPEITAHGFYTRSLTRFQLNKAVKVVQRARNQAFGADE